MLIESDAIRMVAKNTKPDFYPSCCNIMRQI